MTPARSEPSGHHDRRLQERPASTREPLLASIASRPKLRAERAYRCRLLGCRTLGRPQPGDRVTDARWGDQELALGLTVLMPVRFGRGVIRQWPVR